MSPAHEVDDNEVVAWITATGMDDYGPAWSELNNAEKNYRRAEYLMHRRYFLGNK